MKDQQPNLPAPLKPITVQVRRVQPQRTLKAVILFNGLPAHVARAWGVQKGGGQ